MQAAAAEAPSTMTWLSRLPSALSWLAPPEPGPAQQRETADRSRRSRTLRVPSPTQRPVRRNLTRTATKRTGVGGRRWLSTGCSAVGTTRLGPSYQVEDRLLIDDTDTAAETMSEEKKKAGFLASGFDDELAQADPNDNFRRWAIAYAKAKAPVLGEKKKEKEEWKDAYAIIKAELVSWELRGQMYQAALRGGAAAMASGGSAGACAEAATAAAYKVAGRYDRAGHIYMGDDLGAPRDVYLKTLGAAAAAAAAAAYQVAGEGDVGFPWLHEDNTPQRPKWMPVPLHIDFHGGFMTFSPAAMADGGVVTWDPSYKEPLLRKCLKVPLEPSLHPWMEWPLNPDLQSEVKAKTGNHIIGKYFHRCAPPPPSLLYWSS